MSWALSMEPLLRQILVLALQREESVSDLEQPVRFRNDDHTMRVSKEDKVCLHLKQRGVQFMELPQSLLQGTARERARERERCHLRCNGGGQGALCAAQRGKSKDRGTASGGGSTTEDRVRACCCQIGSAV